MQDIDNLISHHLLQKQISEKLSDRLLNDPEVRTFLKEVNLAYNDFESKNADNNSFTHSEKETQILEYTRRLEKINKELDQFAYIVSHDLKAPLRAITNLSEWIEEDLAEKMDETTEKNFSLLRSRIKRMEALIAGVLAYSRAGRIKTENLEIDMNGFLQDVVYQISPPKHFQILIQEDLPTIYSEKLALEQVFANLLSNAIKYNDSENPSIKIGYAEKDSAYEFCIEDNGPGIDPAFHEKIFMIFQTLQSRDILESTGAGLAIVKKIITEKGGKIWIDSHPGAGSKFFFTIPKIVN